MLPNNPKWYIFGTSLLFIVFTSNSLNFKKIKKCSIFTLVGYIFLAGFSMLCSCKVIYYQSKIINKYSIVIVQGLTQVLFFRVYFCRRENVKEHYALSNKVFYSLMHNSFIIFSVISSFITTFQWKYNYVFEFREKKPDFTQWNFTKGLWTWIFWRSHF